MEKSKRISTWWLIGVVVVAAVALLWQYIASRNDLQAITSRAQQMETARQDMEKKYADLKQQLSVVGTDGYIESTARGKFDFLRDGEIRFHIENEEALDGYTPEELHFIREEMRQ